MNKIVLVTGASRGIGLEAAKHFSKEGYKVIGTSRGDFNLGELIGDDSAISVKLDLTSKESIKNLFADLKSKALLPLVLVNNAGITKDQLFLRMKDEDWDDVIDTNLNGLFRVTKAFIKPMVKNKFGRVINISSVVDDLGADSLDTVELLMALEEEFDLEIADEDAEKISTVQAAVDYIVENS